MKNDNFNEEMAAIGQRQFPGGQFGANIEQVRSLIKRQKRLKDILSMYHKARARLTLICQEPRAFY
jgi:hypothetical protein